MKTIWIVEENEIDRYIFQQVIHMSLPDVALVNFPDVTDASRQLEAGLAPDVLVLSIDLPARSAWRFLYDFPKYNLSTTITVAATLLTEVDEEEIRRLGHVKGLLWKPLRAESILQFARRNNLL
jgi:CheY-like chemotaxis protein